MQDQLKRATQDSSFQISEGSSDEPIGMGTPSSESSDQSPSGISYPTQFIQSKAPLEPTASTPGVSPQVSNTGTVFKAYLKCARNFKLTSLQHLLLYCLIAK